MLVQTQFCLFLRRWDEKRGKFILQVIEVFNKPCLSLLAEKSDSRSGRSQGNNNQHWGRQKDGAKVSLGFRLLLQTEKKRARPQLMLEI